MRRCRQGELRLHAAKHASKAETKPAGTSQLIVPERVLALAVTSWGMQEPAMPRYHFNVRQGTNVIRDEEGEEFADLESAQFEARMSAREMLLECIESGRELD